MGTHVQRPRRGPHAPLSYEALDAADVHARIQEVTGAGVPEHLRMDRLAQLGASPSLATEDVHRFAREGLGGGVPGKEPRVGHGLLSIGPQEAQQRRREHDVAVLLSLALLDTEYHPGTVDIGDLQVTDFGDAQSRRREGGQDGPAFEPARGVRSAATSAGLQEDRLDFRAVWVGECMQSSTAV